MFFTFALMDRCFECAEARKQSSRKREPGGCEGRGRLLKFLVCRDAAVYAVSADGFFSVWNSVRGANDWRPVLSA